MGTRTDNRKWLGDDADAPAGNAWDAVLRADYTKLEATLERYGEQATLAAQGPTRGPGDGALRQPPGEATRRRYRCCSTPGPTRG